MNKKTPISKKQPQAANQEKKGLHPRNKHRYRYDFPELIASFPALQAFVAENAYGDLSVDFANPAAVRALNAALLKHYYQVEHWDIPQDYLCPPIPGRADYLHYIADLLAESHQRVVPVGKRVSVLDIGVGASCIYPIIGNAEYGWRFTGSEVDPVSLRAASIIVSSNTTLKNDIRLRQQNKSEAIFKGIIKSNDRFDATLCNPPFHNSPEQAEEGTKRKLTNLGLATTDKPVLNFGGQGGELWCQGGELAFVSKMIEESVAFSRQCMWFTSLISKKTTLPDIYAKLEEVDAVAFRTIEMSQGQKISRIVAWTFLTPEEREKWDRKRENS